MPQNTALYNSIAIIFPGDLPNPTLPLKIPENSNLHKDSCQYEQLPTPESSHWIWHHTGIELLHQCLHLTQILLSKCPKLDSAIPCLNRLYPNRLSKLHTPSTGFIQTLELSSMDFLPDPDNWVLLGFGFQYPRTGYQVGSLPVIAFTPPTGSGDPALRGNSVYWIPCSAYNLYKRFPSFLASIVAFLCSLTSKCHCLSLLQPDIPTTATLGLFFQVPRTEFLAAKVPTHCWFLLSLESKFCLHRLIAVIIA